MGEIILFALLSAVYPTLIAATTLMLLLPKPGRLMFGFWLGAMVTSITCGLVIVFALDESSVANTSKQAVSPAIDLVFAFLLALVALALSKDSDQRVRKRHPKADTAKSTKTPRWRKELGSGNPRHSFIVGIVLSFPGVWYLAALQRLIRLNYSPVPAVVVVVGFCLAQLVLLEIPMLAFRIWPEQTPVAIDNAKAWASVHGRPYAIGGLLVIAGLLVIRACIGLLS